MTKLAQFIVNKEAEIEETMKSAYLKHNTEFKFWISFKVEFRSILLTRDKIHYGDIISGIRDTTREAIRDKVNEPIGEEAILW